MVVPFSESGNIPVDMDKSPPGPDNLKEVYICRDCRKINIPGGEWDKHKKYLIKDVVNNVADALHEFTKILDENKLTYEIPSMITCKSRSHIFSVKIRADYDYFIDMYSHADFREVLENTELFKSEFPSRKIAIFNISDEFSDRDTGSEIEYYSAASKDDLVLKLRQYVNKLITSKEYRFGIDEFDNILLYGLEENNVYGIETFSSGNTLYFLSKFLMQGALNGQNGLYITTRYSPEYILKIADSFGINIKQLVNDKKIFIFDGNSSLEKFQHSESDIWKIRDHISKVISEIGKYITKYNIKRLVIDSIEPLEISPGEDSIRYLFNELKNLDCVTMATKYINNINSNSIEDMYFTGIVEIGTVIDLNSIKNIIVIKKFMIRDNSRRLVEYNITDKNTLEIK
ncbi:RAD55 family ATPase [Ferroplasma acidarmanus]|uniref:ATPase n=4 Tax=Ferroplasma TaxID=74968 RepID=S0APD7_FERAC|nr:RAD55 family ATPase [Ferroplasma acidarmanus]AGO60059.1 ATPase [Ferroplasma acidarmanus Fer1]